MPAVQIVHRRGFSGLVSRTASTWPDKVRVVAAPDETDESARLVVLLRDHPDTWRGAADGLTRRWPLCEILLVDSPWGISARRTRPDEPSGWTVSVGEAEQRIAAVAVDPDAASPRPWTLTYGERAAGSDVAADDWPFLGPPVAEPTAGATG